MYVICELSLYTEFPVVWSNKVSLDLTYSAATVCAVVPVTVVSDYPHSTFSGTPT